MNVMTRFVSALPGYWESLKWLLTHGTRSDSDEETSEEPPTKRRRKDVGEHTFFDRSKPQEQDTTRTRLHRLLGEDSSDDFLLSLKDPSFSLSQRNARRKSHLEISSSTPNSRSFGSLRLSMGKENVISGFEDEKVEKEEVPVEDEDKPKSCSDSKLLKDLHQVVEDCTSQDHASWVDMRTNSRVIERRDSGADKENDLEVVKAIAPIFLEKKSNPSVMPPNVLNVASRPLARSVEKMQTSSFALKRPNSGSLSSTSTGHPSLAAPYRKCQLLDESVRLHERKIYSELLQNFTKVPIVKYHSHPERFRRERLLSLTSLPPVRKKVQSSVEVIDLTSAQDLASDGKATNQLCIDRKQIAALMKPTPSSLLRQKLDKCNVYDVTWMTELTKAYRRKDRENQRKILDEKVKAALATKRSEQMLNEILEERVRVHLRLSDVAVEEGPLPVAEEEVSLPKLTPEMEKRIAYVFKSGPGNEVIVDKFSLRITRRDMHTLVGTNWLNDEVINFYMNLLIERGKQDNYPSVYCFNTFFYPKLASQGHASLKRWTRRIDIFANEMLMIPVHLGVHWCLATINFKEKKIQYYDSMGGANNTCLQNLLRYLEDECLDKKKIRFDSKDWVLVNVQDNPQQMNGSDCGMFSCMYAEYLCRRAKINFSQSDMPYFRRKMAYEIMTAHLLL